MKKTILCFSAFCLLVLSLNSCKKPKDDGPSEELKKAAITNYANIVYANYSDALTKAQALKTAIDVFVATPTQSNLDAAKQAWKDARVPYGQSEVYRFYNGPIDNETDGPEGLLNAWPMDESSLDYVDTSLTTGLVNDLTFTINKANVEAKNEKPGETNISCGYHAIEFLLWGQDLSTSGPGARPYTDYVTVGGTHLNQGRRGNYLKVCAELLVDHLQTLVDAWSPSAAGNYRQSFTSGSTSQALTFIIQGMGFLSKGELAGERIEVAYEAKDQEDEHSCFSDNTTVDVSMNALGIKNVYLGSYTQSNGTVVSGTSVYDVLKVANGTLAEDLKTAVTASVTAADAIPAPFDRAIVETTGRTKVKTAIDALKAQGDKIAEGARALGLTVVIQ